MTPKEFLQEKGIHPEEPIYWYGENEFLTLDNLMQEYSDKQLILQGVMPRNLSAENGAKDLLRGEFVECFDPDESGNPYIVPITWDSIKKIYKRIVEHYVA